MSENVSFGPTKLIGGFGILVGGLVAIGIPYVVVVYGANINLGSTAAIILSLLGIIGGIALAITAVVLSIVIPSKVSEDKEQSKS